MKGFYLNLSSKSSIYKTNTAVEFTVALRPEITLTGNWGVGLIEILLPSETTLKTKYLLANFIQTSVVGETRRSVLRVIYDNKQHISCSPEYIPVTDKLLDTLVFELVDAEGDTLELTGVTQLRLHFMPW